MKKTFQRYAMQLYTGFNWFMRGNIQQNIRSIISFFDRYMLINKKPKIQILRISIVIAISWAFSHYHLWLKYDYICLIMFWERNYSLVYYGSILDAFFILQCWNMNIARKNWILYFFILISIEILFCFSIFGFFWVFFYL